MIDPAITWFAALALAAIFAASAIMKLADLDEFRGALENYRIAPSRIAPILTFLIPIAEFAGAAMIIIPATRADAAALLLALIAIFTAAIAINLIRGRLYIDCGCFGPALRQKISWWLVARNAALAILAIVVMTPEFERQLEILDGATIALGAITTITLYAAVNYLLANAPRLAALEMSDA
jgi:uncharacterized membrane protein YphA (DoxX/SURF4 family)